MSTQPNDPTGGPGPAGGADPAGGASAPSEEELRAAYEAELNRINATDMIAQSAVSMLNLGARRLQPVPPEGQTGAAGSGGAGAEQGGRDREQARDAIDAARALLEILERRIPQELKPLRDALSQLQMAYARELQAAPPKPQESAVQQPPAGSTASAGAPPQGAPKGADGEEAGSQPGPGPAQASGRLWVPGS